MAEDIRSMRIELSMKDMGIQRTVGQINKSFRALKSEVSTSSKKLQYGEKSVASYEKNVKDLTLAHKASRQNLKELTRQYHEVGKAQGYSSSQALGLQKSISDQEREMHFLGRQIVNTTNEMNEFKTAQKVDNTSWAKMGKGFEGMSTKIRGVSTQMAEIGSSLTNKITKPALIAGAAMGGITAKLGFDRLVGLDTAKAKLEGLGYSTKEVGSITGQVTNAIKGGMTTMAEGTDVAAGALAAGVKEGKELEHYIKLVGDAAVGSNRPVSEMAMIFNRVQGQGKLMTQELNMVEEGMPGFSNAMAKHLGVSYDAFREMVTAGEVSAKDFTTVMDDFAGGMAGAYSKSWQGMVQNTKAYIGMIGESLLSGVFEQAKGSLHEFEKLLQSDGAQKWASQTGAKLANAFTVIANGISGVVKWWNGLGSTTQSVLGGIVKWSALTLVAVGPLLSIFSKIGFMVAGVFGPFGKFLGIIGKVAVASKSAGGIIAGITTLFPKLGAALMVATGPVGWIVAAIVGLGVAMVVAYKKSETFRNIVNGAFTGIVNGAKALWSGIMTILIPIGQAFVKFGGQIKSAIGDFWSKYGAQFMQAITNIKNGFLAFWNFISPVLGFIGGLFKSTFSDSIPVIQFFKDLIMGSLVHAFNIVKASVQIAFGAIKGIIMGVLNVVMGFVKMFIGIFTGDWKLFGEGIKQVIKSALSIIKNLFQLTFSGILGFVKVIWSVIRNTIVNFAKSIWTGIRTNFNNAKNATISIFTTVKNWLIKTWTSIRNSVVNFAKSIWNGIRTNFNNSKNSVISIYTIVKNWLIKTWSSIRNSVVNFAKSIWNGIRSNFNNTKNSIVSIFTIVKNWLIKTWTNIKNAVVSRAKSIWNGVKNNFTNLWNSVRNIITTVKNWLINTWNTIKNKVVNLAKSLWNGVKDKFNGLKKSATDITQKLKNAVKDKWEALKKNVVDLATGAKDGVVKGFKAMYDKGVEWLDKLKGFIKNAKDGFKKVATDLGKGVANGAISGLNAMIDGINTLSDKIMKKKLIKKKIPKLSTGTAASPGVQTNSQGQLTKSTRAVVNDKGLGNARGPGGHKEIIQRRNGKMIQPKGRNKVVRLKRGDAVHNGMQSKALRPHLSTGTGMDLLKNGKKHKKHDEVYGDVPANTKGGGGSWNPATAIADGSKGAWDWTKDQAKKAKDTFGKAIGDVMDYATNPGKLIGKVMKHFGVDFSGVGGEAMGGTMSWAYDGLKKGLKDLVSGWFTELEGDGDGGYIDLSKGINFPFSPNGRAPGYPFPYPHNGIDLNYIYDKLYSVASGTATSSTTAGGFGKHVTITDGIMKYIYGHMSKFAFSGSKKVKPGDYLGVSGNTGMSSGPHLHFEVQKNGQPIDPLSWLKKNNGGGKASGKYGSTIKKALGMAGLPQTSQYIKAWQEQARTESTFNPKARNASGASGLVQVKPATFAANKLPGHGDIWNPLDNLIAGMRYAKGRYGTKGMLKQIGHGLPYKTGGIINQNGMYNLAEDGHSEVVVPLDPARASDAMKLITYAQSKIKDKKNKRPNQVPTPSTNSNNTGSDNTNLLLQMIANQQKQLDALMDIARSNKGIENKPLMDEPGLSKQQARRLSFETYSIGGTI